MKNYLLDNGNTLLDNGMGMPLINVNKDLEIVGLDSNPTKIKFSSYDKKITAKGREILYLYHGDNNMILSIRTGSCDRDWDDWDLYQSECISSGIYTQAKATSNGGGCWIEFTIANEKHFSEYGSRATQNLSFDESLIDQL